MSHSDVFAIRELIRRTLPQLGFPPETTWRETFLIRDGFYAGRRFNFEGGYALWAANEWQVAFCDTEGELLKVAEIEATEEYRKAA